MKCEKDLINLYNTKTTNCKEMGYEYFIGEYQQMKKLYKNTLAFRSR
jgi:hypothetical protein